MHFQVIRIVVQNEKANVTKVLAKKPFKVVLYVFMLL